MVFAHMKNAPQIKLRVRGVYNSTQEVRVMRKLIIIVSIALLGVVGCGKSRTQIAGSGEIAEPVVVPPTIFVMRGENSVKEVLEESTEGEASEVPAQEKLIKLSFNFSKLEGKLEVSDYSMTIQQGETESIIDSKNSSLSVVEYKEQEEADDVLEMHIDRDMGEGKGIRYCFYDGFLNDSSFKFNYFERSLIKDAEGQWTEESPKASFSGAIKLEKVIEEEKKEEVKTEEAPKIEEPQVTEQPAADTPSVEGSEVEGSETESQDEVVSPENSGSEEKIEEGTHEESHEGSSEESK